jgi:hypothetical protein
MNRILARGLYGLGLAGILTLGPLHHIALAQTSAQTQLAPDFDISKFRFGTGKVVDNKPQILSTVPNIPGASSGWTVIQWSNFNHMAPDSMSQNDPATADPDLGPAAYGFTAPDKLTHLWIYQKTPDGHPVYELYESNGSVGGAGGRNLFLSTGIKQPATFDHDIHFSMQAKVSRAEVSYDTPQSEKSGAVLGMAFIGFAMNFPSPVDGSSSVFFLQVGIAKSANKDKLKMMCTMSKTGRIILLAGGTLSGAPPLAFKADSGPLKTIAFSVNDYVKAVFSKPIGCQVKGVGQKIVSLANINPAQIGLKTVYIGLETQNADHRPSAASQGPQGNVELGIQLSDVHITE